MEAEVTSASFTTEAPDALLQTDIENSINELQVSMRESMESQLLKQRQIMNELQRRLAAALGRSLPVEALQGAGINAEAAVRRGRGSDGETPALADETINDVGGPPITSALEAPLQSFAAVEKPVLALPVQCKDQAAELEASSDAIKGNGGGDSKRSLSSEAAFHSLAHVNTSSSNDISLAELEAVADGRPVQDQGNVDAVGHVYNTKKAKLVAMSRVKGSAGSILPADRFPLKQLMALGNWWSTLEEPDRNGPLAKIINATWFGLMCAVVILMNSVTTVLAANYQAQDLQAGTPPVFELMDLGFCVFYSIELALKIAVHGGYLWVNEDMWWNALDTVLVVVSVWNQISIAYGGTVVEISFMRAFRIMKVARLLRLLRSVNALNALRTMVDALMNSVMSLVWCLALLVFTLGMFSLLIIQPVTEFRASAGDACILSRLGPCLQEDLTERFGSVADTMLTLYAATTGGFDWEVAYWMLYDVDVWGARTFVIFTAVYYFGLFNLLTGMFVDHTMQASSPDTDTVIFNQRVKEYTETLELRRLCEGFDFDHNKQMNFDEFQSMIRDDRMSSYLTAIGLDITDCKPFFKVIGSVTGRPVSGLDHEVSIDAFVQGCMRMKGPATSIDLISVQMELHEMHARQAILAEEVQRMDLNLKDAMVHGYL